MADLLDGLARYLQGLGLCEYEPNGVGGDCFIEAVPPAPDECIVLTLYGGDPSDGKLGYDRPRLQVRTRGTQDPRVSRTRAEAIRAQLDGLGRTELPDGSLLLSVEALQTAAVPLGPDAQRRHEHTVNYQLELRSLTAHRE